MSLTDSSSPGLGRPSWRLMGLCLGAWTLFGLIAYAQDVSGRTFVGDPRPWQEWGYWTSFVCISAGLTPCVLWLARRFEITRAHWARSALLHFTFSVGFGITRAVLQAPLALGLRELGFLGPTPWGDSLWATATMQLIVGIPSGVVAYWLIMTVQAAARYYERFRERERRAMQLEIDAATLREQVVAARLDVLKTQLQPHFLFNTLNAIVALLRQQRAEEAEEAVTRFSDLLRAVLEEMDAQEVTLERELQHLKLYLSIEQMRFSDRLSVEYEIDQEVLDALVPHMVLQPLVENAVRHGINRRESGGTIRVCACRLRNALRIEVSDYGPAMPANSEAAGHGRGLSNLRARLVQMYGVGARLDLDIGLEGVTRATLTMPLRNHVVGIESDVKEIRERGLEV